jgi:transcriptional regulator with XRE-family HTH domain
MGVEPIPIASQALAVLRRLAGWGQKQLAAAAGLARETISAYEQGDPAPAREQLIALAGLMSFRPSRVDKTLAYVRDTLEEGALPPAGTAEAASALDEQVDELARQWGEAEREVARRRLQQFLRDTDQLAARHRAPELWARLKAHPEEARPAVVERGTEFHCWALAELLGEESERAAFDCEKRTVELAELALGVARRVPGGEAWRREVESHAWAYLGNARRVAGDLPGAEAAFRRCRALAILHPELPPGPLSPVRRLDLEISLRNDLRHLPEALALAEEALGRCRRPEDRRRVLIKQAYTLELAGEEARAIDTLRQAAGTADSEREPRLRFLLLFNLATNLCELGQVGEAAAVLPEIRAVSAGAERGLDRLRLTWLEGRVAGGEGRVAEALALLEEVRRELVRRGIPFDAALVTLELAALWAEEGQPAEVKALARDLPALFAALGVARETLAALALYCRAAEAEEATAALARELLAALRRMERRRNSETQAEG